VWLRRTASYGDCGISLGNSGKKLSRFGIFTLGSDFASMVALNSIGLNVSRAIGPALAGAIIAASGMAAPFWINALSIVGVIAALIWWHPPEEGAGRHLPPEQFHRAIGAGLRHARYNPRLRAALVRAAGFFLFASVKITGLCKPGRPGRRQRPDWPSLDRPR
jgi:MFS family permease